MNTRTLLALTALTVSALASGARADTGTPPPPAPAPTTPVTMPGAASTAMASSWAALVGTGSAALLDAEGTVIGSVSADGTVTLEGDATLADVRAVQVAGADGGTPVVYTFTRDVSRPGAIKVAVTGPNGKVLSLPLPAALHRAQRTPDTTAPDPADDDDGVEDGAGEHADGGSHRAGAAGSDRGGGHGSKRR